MIYMMDEILILKMDKKLYQQLRRYSFHQNQSLAKTARNAINMFINENSADGAVVSHKTNALSKK